MGSKSNIFDLFLYEVMTIKNKPKWDGLLFFKELRKNYFPDLNDKECVNMFKDLFLSLRVSKCFISSIKNTQWKKITYIVNEHLKKEMKTHLYNVSKPYLNFKDRNFIKRLHLKGGFKNEFKEDVINPAEDINKTIGEMSKQVSELKKYMDSEISSGVESVKEEFIKFFSDYHLKREEDLNENNLLLENMKLNYNKIIESRKNVAVMDPCRNNLLIVKRNGVSEYLQKGGKEYFALLEELQMETKFDEYGYEILVEKTIEEPGRLSLENELGIIFGDFRGFDNFYSLPTASTFFDDKKMNNIDDFEFSVGLEVNPAVVNNNEIMLPVVEEEKDKKEEKGKEKEVVKKEKEEKEKGVTSTGQKPKPKSKSVSSAANPSKTVAVKPKTEEKGKKGEAVKEGEVVKEKLKKKTTTRVKSSSESVSIEEGGVASKPKVKKRIPPKRAKEEVVIEKPKAVLPDKLVKCNIEKKCDDSVVRRALSNSNSKNSAELLFKVIVRAENDCNKGEFIKSGEVLSRYKNLDSIDRSGKRIKRPKSFGRGKVRKKQSEKNGTNRSIKNKAKHLTTRKLISKVNTVIGSEDSIAESFNLEMKARKSFNEIIKKHEINVSASVNDKKTALVNNLNRKLKIISEMGIERRCIYLALKEVLLKNKNKIFHKWVEVKYKMVEFNKEQDPLNLIFRIAEEGLVEKVINNTLNNFDQHIYKETFYKISNF